MSAYIISYQQIPFVLLLLVVAIVYLVYEWVRQLYFHMVTLLLLLILLIIWCSFYKLLNHNDDLDCSYLFFLSEFFLLGSLLFQNDKLHHFTTNINVTKLADNQKILRIWWRWHTINVKNIKLFLAALKCTNSATCADRLFVHFSAARKSFMFFTLIVCHLHHILKIFWLSIQSLKSKQVRTCECVHVQKGLWLNISYQFILPTTTSYKNSL
jgi:hypothetical protein